MPVVIIMDIVQDIRMIVTITIRIGQVGLRGMSLGRYLLLLVLLGLYGVAIGGDRRIG